MPAALDPIGGLLGVQEFPATAAGYARLLAWLGRWRIDFGAEDHEQAMLALGYQSKREITRTKIRVRAAMAAQTREQGRYLGGRPPYGYRLADAGRTRIRRTPRGGGGRTGM